VTFGLYFLESFRNKFLEFSEDNLKAEYLD